MNTANRKSLNLIDVAAVGLFLLAAALSGGCAPQASHTLSSEQAADGPTPVGGVAGKALYAAQCARCHDTGGAKPIPNRTTVQIEGALNSVASMSGIRLSMAQIHSLEIYLDQVAPNVGIVSPANGATLAALGAVTGICESGLEVIVSIDTQAAASASCTGGAFTYSPTQALSSGSHAIEVAQTDLNGNKKTAMITVSIDNTAPAITISAPAAGAGISSPALNVSGQCELRGEPVSIGGSALAAPVQVTCSSSGAYAATVTAIGPNGTKTLIVEQTDRAGNKGSSSRSVQVNFPTSAPSVAITAPAANLVTRAGIMLTGTCTSGLAVQIGGSGVSAVASVTCASGIFNSAIAFSSGVGQKTIVVSQANSLGQMGQDARGFIFDNVAPAVTIAMPAAGTQSGTGVTLSGACEDGLDVVVGGSGTSASQTVACASGKYSAAVAFSSGLGTKSVSVTQTDQAGNTGAVSRSFTRIDPTADLYKNAAYGKQGLRRLTRYELVNSLSSALSLDPSSKLGSIPEDLAVTTYFDNEQGAQPISAAVVTAYGDFAKAFSAEVVASAARVSQLAGCTASSAGDRGCFVTFAQKIGRRLLRRAFTSTEANRYADVLLPYAVADNRFATAVQLFLQALLQHPEFLYRVEGGTATNGLVVLNDFQIATRMSFLLWGSSPDDTLLNAAESGQLKAEANRLGQAQRMLSDARARRHFARFHAEWLGFEDLQLHPTLDSDMRAETRKLVERVVFDDNEDWMDLFKSNETYVTPALAAHYGLPAISSPTWVTYMGQRGGGVLSHGSLARLGAKFSDTSPTLRGYELFKRLLCGKFTGSIPAGVDTDIAPGSPNNCKPQNYTMRTMASCQGCHAITDNIGFGMENISAFGQWRNVEPGLPQCTITGEGSVSGQPFVGPRGLGNLLALDDRLNACATRQLFRFMSGRLETSADEATVNALNAQYEQSRTLSSLLLSLIKTPAIMYKGAP